jgi:hypothetical protein
VLIKRGILAALFDDALSDNSPLFTTISRDLNEAMVAAIAKAYDERRLLLIGTTDLDAHGCSTLSVSRAESNLQHSRGKVRSLESRQIPESANL